MAKFGVLDYGAYVPRRRMARSAILDAVGWAQGGLRAYAKGERAFAAWDEDAITMGVEAARAALTSAKDDPDILAFASTTAPFLDRQNAGVIVAALDLRPSLRSMDVSGSQRAGLSAILSACEATERSTLVVAAEKRPVKSASVLEMVSGDAAAAMLFGAGDPVAEFVAAHSTTVDFVDHFRTEASGADYSYEERWVREAGFLPIVAETVRALLQKAGVGPREVGRLAAGAPSVAALRPLAEAVGIRAEAASDHFFDNVGCAGAAHPLLAFAGALDAAGQGELILVFAFGQGCDAALFRATRAGSKKETARAIAGGATEKNYVKFLAASGRVDIDWGMRAERDNRTAQTVAFNRSRDIYGFVGGVCSACETPQFPKSRRCVNPSCAALDTQQDYRFADRRGVIKTFTEDHLAFTREPPLVYGNVSFAGGGNVFMEMADFAPGEAAVGAAVEMRFRIKDIDAARGFHRYFWKAAPARGAAHG
jgi:3-hydroxy-3-methylglutaryl CoA synthase